MSQPAARTLAPWAVPVISESGAKSAAGRIRCTVEEYRQHEANGEFWCGMGRHWVDGDVFVWSGRTTGGRYGYCRPCAADKHRREYVPQRAHVEGLKNVRYAGPDFSKRAHHPYTLTPEGAATVTTVERHADSEAGAVTRRNGIPPVVASSGHIHCHPSIRHLCDGRLPVGWVRESEVAS